MSRKYRNKGVTIMITQNEMDKLEFLCSKYNTNKTVILTSILHMSDKVQDTINDVVNKAREEEKDKIRRLKEIETKEERDILELIKKKGLSIDDLKKI